MAEYSDPLIEFLAFEYDAVYLGRNKYAVQNKAQDRIGYGDTETAAWADAADKVRVGHRPIDEETRLTIVTRLVLYASYPKVNVRQAPIDRDELDKRLKLSEYLKGPDWRDARTTAAAILGMEFAPITLEGVLEP